MILLKEAYELCQTLHEYKDTYSVFYSLMKDNKILETPKNNPQGKKVYIDMEKVNFYFKQRKFIDTFSIKAIQAELKSKYTPLYYVILKNNIPVIKIQNQICVQNEEEKQNVIRLYKESRKSH